jgi:hypothetical protein
MGGHTPPPTKTRCSNARTGRAVSASRDGKIVWITPAEIFGRYGFDEFGRPKAE